jgi:hypothetical protein
MLNSTHKVLFPCPAFVRVHNISTLVVLHDHMFWPVECQNKSQIHIKSETKQWDITNKCLKSIRLRGETVWCQNCRPSSEENFFIRGSEKYKSVRKCFHQIGNTKIKQLQTEDKHFQLPIYTTTYHKHIENRDTLKHWYPEKNYRHYQLTLQEKQLLTRFGRRKIFH